MSKKSKAVNLKKSFLVIFAVILCFVNKSFASDNVLQAIQIDGVKDSYNIILKSDDIAELKKTIQAPNKMMLTLNGIRASKTINTIYNNTSNVDSVVVEPTGENSVKILIQASNASNAQIKFDTLKTPLGVLDRTERENKATDELLLSGPVDSYRPVYTEPQNEYSSALSLDSISVSAVKYIKKILKSEKLNWLITAGLFLVLILNSLKNIKSKDNDIKVGLTQSLADREIHLYKDGYKRNAISELASSSMNRQQSVNMPNINVGTNYGLKAYQNGTRNPYITSDIQRPHLTPTPSVNLQPAAKSAGFRQTAQGAIRGTMKSSVQSTMQNTIQQTAPVSVKPKTANIDSMKFLESMTKIYEKNGRTDLAQGLKANIKKAKTNLV